MRAVYPRAPHRRGTNGMLACACHASVCVTVPGLCKGGAGLCAGAKGGEKEGESHSCILCDDEHIYGRRVDGVEVRQLVQSLPSRVDPAVQLHEHMKISASLMSAQDDAHS